MAPQARARLLRFLSTFVHHVARTTLAIVACVAFASSAFAQTIAAGSLHTVVATPDGNVWTWGSNASSQLGLGAGASSKKVPTQIPTLSNIIAVAAGNDFSLALDSSGVVWAWGSNGFGQLGNGNNTTQNTPVALSLTNIVAIAASDGHSVALDSSGVVYTWGYNFYGQLGNSSTASSNTPVQLSTPTSVSAIAAGVYHTLVVKTDGSVYGWGWNVSGQLGTGSTTPNNQTSPVQMSGISSGAAAVAGGSMIAKYPKLSGHNDVADAYRHCYWSCCMTQKLGAEEAKRWGDGHESGMGNDCKERDMDYHNNYVGRRLAAWNPKGDCGTLCEPKYLMCTPPKECKNW